MLLAVAACASAYPYVAYTDTQCSRGRMPLADIVPAGPGRGRAARGGGGVRVRARVRACVCFLKGTLPSASLG